MSSVTSYTGTLGSHQISLEFDQRLVVLNRARLSVDGVEVDQARVVYGTKELSVDLDDGTAVSVRLHSGMVGEIDRPQVLGPDGTWHDLTEG